MKLRLLIALLCAGIGAGPNCAVHAQSATPETTVTVRVTPQPVATFRPAEAFGAGVDGLEQGDVAQVYTPPNIQAMAGVGYQSLTYRLRTELAIEAWHWNPAGAWSDPARRQGYWTSNASPAAPIQTCYGYRLPRRGSTIDQAGNDGYSRLDDGSNRTFWKSNPYLDKTYTDEDNSRHPQWVVIDLGRARPVNAVHIAWAMPYAVCYQAQYWTGADTHDDDLDQTYSKHGDWRVFPMGTITHGVGGDALLRVCRTPLSVRFVRLWLTVSDVPRSLAGIDQRDRVGYAMREVGVGRMDGVAFHDWVRHAPRRLAQTTIYASSTDPWHDASCRDPNVEQPGFDRALRVPLTHGLSALVPVGVLYDTPDNAAAEIRYLEQRGIALRGVEMGEEPDGQYAVPEDYAALYIQFARTLHAADPRLLLGGPSFQTNVQAWTCWPDASGNRSWLGRFLGYLARHGQSQNFNFFSFEWYPFDDVCAPSGPQLLEEPALLAHTLAQLRRDGLPAAMPCLMTEYGYSAFAGQAEMDLPGGILNAEIAAQFLTLGGKTAYVYGLEPNSPMPQSGACMTWGNLALYLSQSDRRIRQPLATFWSEQMLTRQWAQPGANGQHALYRAEVAPPFTPGKAWVTAYAVRRPDGDWAVLLLNKDARRSRHIRMQFLNTQTHHIIPRRGAFTAYQFGPAQYRWHALRAHGFASPDLAPVQTRFPTHAPTAVTLPPLSITVLRCRLD